MEDQLTPRSWHAIGTEEALRLVSSGSHGLTAPEAAARLSRYGMNRLPRGPRRSVLRRFLSQFNNLLIYVLLGSASLSAALSHYVDAGVILVIVLLNAIIGFIQEGRAEQALEAISRLVDPKCSVMRDGHRITVPAEEIVPGDIIPIEAGDRIPADLRLLRGRSLKIDEAILTGESVAVDKSADPVPMDAPLGDRVSMAFGGTFVAAGQGYGVVVGTGTDTELGRITTLLGQVETLSTPLIRQMDAFGRQLTFIVLGICVLTFGFAYLVRAYSATEAFMAVVGVAVSAIPEGLPAMITITLALGVQQMAARNAIVRRLPAVETLGSVSVICTDKTGTLTRNEMTACAVVTTDNQFDISGVGYNPHGAVNLAGVEVEPEARPDFLNVVRAGVLCNDANLRQADSVWMVDGDPMEGALITLGQKAGIDPAFARKELTRTDEIPFDSQHRFMATLHHTHDADGYIFIKGAPEKILAMCSLENRGEAAAPIDRAAWLRRADTLAAEGQRVLAFARKRVSPHQTEISFADVEDGLTILGLVGFIDPPREEAIAAVRQCKEAGMRVVMITGDHAVTAREIGRQLGLAAAPVVLEGQALDALDDEALRTKVREVDVFARTTPHHKLRLVQALQAQGLIVAMTGDGVNDAPALKRADVGIAMGQKGTEVAKQASEVVLADDNFASIVAAVREGRTIYDNILKMISWTLPTNSGEALTIMAALALGLAMPITPVQILWVNMITAVALGLTLAFEPTEPNAMRRPPRRANEPVLGAELIWRVAFVSVLFVGGAFGIFFWAEAQGLALEQARTLVVNTLVVMEIFYLFSVRYVHGSSFTWQGVLGTPAVLTGIVVVTIAQLALTYAPFMHAVFDTQAVSLGHGAAVIGVGIALLILAEIEKILRRKLLRA